MSEGLSGCLDTRTRNSFMVYVQTTIEPWTDMVKDLVKHWQLTQDEWTFIKDLMHVARSRLPEVGYQCGLT